MEQTSSVVPQRSPGPELRLLDRRALVGFPALSVSPGLAITDFALQIPNVTFPFNVTGGALRYQRQRLDFAFLDLVVDAEWIARKFATAVGRLTEIEELQLSFRHGYLEGQGRIATGQRTPFTFKIGFDADGERLALIFYEVRLYGFSPVPSPQIPVLLARFAEEIKLLPAARRKGSSGFTADLLPDLVRVAAVSRGYRMPSLDHARLSSVEANPQGLRLRFSSGGLPPVPAADDDLMLTLEGSRAFFEAEELIARGRLGEARELFLRYGDAQDAHPFAAERLLGLLVADPRAHELVIDVSASLARRRERSAAALWTEAVVRECRGERARAAERYLALCELARKAGEETSAFLAAEAAARAASDQVPQIAVRALHELLGVRPDHLPSLKALARASDLAGDRGGAIRAYRRIAALARDPLDSAQAHVELARLSSQAEDDLAGARLHCEASLRLAPDYPDALELLAELCFRSGEHLRAIKAADRLREVALGRHELQRVGRADLFAGKVWELGLKQLDNALLRYREAASLMPADPEPAYLRARVAERMGRLQEALAAYQQAVELAGPSPDQQTIREAAHQSRRALAQMSIRLGNPAKAREHLEAALALDPKDKDALQELVPYYRASGRAAELADACEKAAAIEEEAKRRAALLAEAGELYRTRLGNLAKAETLLAAALELDSLNRAALEALLALAESRRDGAQMARCLKSLALLASDPKERARHYRRLAVVARDLTFDSELATFALSEILRLEPSDVPTLAELCSVHRRRGDVDGLALALEQRARLAEEEGDARTAALSLRELAQVLEVRLGRSSEAFFAIEKAARLSPEPEVMLEFADLSMRCGRPDQARRAYEAALSFLSDRIAPQRLAEIQAKLGAACDQSGDRDAARIAFARALPSRLLDDQVANRLEELSLDANQPEGLADLWYARADALLSAQRSSEAAALFFKSGDALLKSGDVAGALSRLQAALEANPSGPLAEEILHKLSVVHLERGEPREASSLVARQAALVKDGSERTKLLFRAASLIQGTAEEQVLLAQSIAEDAQFIPARIRRAELLLQSDPEQALGDLETVLAAPVSAPDAPAPEVRMDLTRKAAFLALKLGQTEAARRYLDQCLRYWPEDVEIQSQLAKLHRQVGAKDQLFDLLMRLWPRLDGPDRGEACREAADLALELGRREDAAVVLRSLLEVKPGDVWASKALLRLLPEAGASEAEEQELRSLLSTVIEATSGAERAGLLCQRAGCYRRVGDLEKAKADLTEAATGDTQSARVFEELAELAHQSGDERGELVAWAEGTQRQPSMAEKAIPRLLVLSRSRLDQGDLETARRGFSIAAELASADLQRCEAFLGLADLHSALGDSAAVASALQQAASHGPAYKRIDAHLRRGALLEQRGDWAEAAQSYEAVLALAAHYPAASSGLIRVFRAAGDWSRLAEVLAVEAAELPRDQAAPVYAELGTIYLERLSQKGPAEAALKQAVRIDTSNLVARRQLASILIDRSELTEAVELLEDGAQIASPEDGAKLLGDGMELARRAGESELALRLGRKAHLLGLKDRGFLRELADLLYLQGALNEALPLQRKLAAESDFAEFPEEGEEALLRLADLAERLSDGALAEKTLRELLRERPLCLPAAERLSQLMGSDRPREAIEVLWSYATQLGASDRSADLLVSLAKRAREELADFDLAARLLRDAAERAEDPLPIQQQLLELYRAAGRLPELIEELRAVAAQTERAGNLDAALQVLAEEAALCEQSGRVDDALTTLNRLRAVCEEAGRTEQAGFYQRRRAELLRDLKQDPDAAEEALKSSFQLCADLATAEEGQALAVKRNDARSEAEWIERSLELRPPAARGEVLARLGELLAGPLGAADRAVHVLRAALDADPQSDKAEELLKQLFESSGKVEELALHYQRMAERAQDPSVRVKRWREAATIYRERLQNSGSAVACLMAAHAEAPNDLELAVQTADLLCQLGRREDAAELDEAILKADPLNERIFTRQLAFLEEQAEHRPIAALRVVRAEKLDPEAAAAEYLRAADSYRSLADEDRARWCEEKAFELAPFRSDAFSAARGRAGSNVRQLADVLARRAEAVPEEAYALLRERAEALVSAGELLPGAAAYDDLLRRFPNDLTALVARADLAAQPGGPMAAQPFDRRLLAILDDQASVELRAKTQLRLGQAALASNALRDAAEALEAVLELDPQGPRGRESLSLLADVYSRASNAEGLYRVTLRQAAGASRDEAEALYRRAAGLVPDPATAIDALLALATSHPADPALVERTAAGLASLGRHRELVDLYAKSAQALGGIDAAEMLEKAANLAAEKLGDCDRERDLREQAGRIYTRVGDWSKAAPLLEVAAKAGSASDTGLLIEAAESWVAAGEPERARSLFERALSQDRNCLVAARLFELEPTVSHAEAFVSAAEAVVDRKGPAAIEPVRELLANAYQALSQTAKAYQILCELEETEPRLRRRIALANELGLSGESLQLQQRLTDDPAELEKVLQGYLQANLLPSAVRLAYRLLESGAVSLQARRSMAERFASSAEGAALAQKLWLEFLKGDVLDQEGWRLYAQALRTAGQPSLAEVAGGFGAALSSSTATPAPVQPVRVLERSFGNVPRRPEGLIPITPQSMPRLYDSISPTLRELAGAEMKILLHPSGGVEGYLLNSDEFLLGAAALGCFGAAELGFVCALAIALGDRGYMLATPKAIGGFDQALCVAFDALPSSLAASRVIAQLDPRVRGSNPANVDASQVLRSNSSFRALAIHWLALR